MIDVAVIDDVDGSDWLLLTDITLLMVVIKLFSDWQWLKFWLVIQVSGIDYPGHMPISGWMGFEERFWYHPQQLCLFFYRWLYSAFYCSTLLSWAWRLMILTKMWTWYNLHLILFLKCAMYWVDKKDLKSLFANTLVTNRNERFRNLGCNFSWINASVAIYS